MKIETINPNGTPGVNIPPPEPKTSLHKDPYDPNQQPAKRGEESLPPFAQGGPRDQHPETNSNMQPTGTNTHHPTRGPRMQGDAQVWYRPPPDKEKDTQEGQDARHPTRPAAVRARASKNPGHPPFSREILHPQHEFRGSSNLATLTNTETPSPPESS